MRLIDYMVTRVTKVTGVAGIVITFMFIEFSIETHDRASTAYLTTPSPFSKTN